MPLWIGTGLCATLLLPAATGWWLPLLGVAALAWGVLGIRRVERDGGRITIRGLAHHAELSANAAFGYDVSGGRNAQLNVYATDGERTCPLWSMMPLGSGAADRVVAKLERALQTKASAAATEIVGEDRRRIAEAEAPVKAYYASGKPRKVAIGIGIGVAVYLAVMAVVIALDR